MSTFDLLEKNVANLENGSEAAAFSSGMAAVSAVIAAFPDAFVLYPNDTYHGVKVVMEDVFQQWGCKISNVDMVKHLNLTIFQRSLNHPL